jgi:hypothetical protein
MTIDALPTGTPPSPAIIRPAEHALLRPGAFRACTPAEGRALLADLVGSGRMTAEQARKAVVFIPWVGGGSATAYTSWQKTPNRFTGSYTSAISIRNIVLASEAAYSGSEVRLWFKAGDAAWAVSHCAIGIRSGSTGNTTATPTEVLFGGASGFSLAAYAEIGSDWQSFTFNEAVDHLVICDQTSGKPAFTQPGSSYYYLVGGSTYSQASPGGLSSGGDASTYGIFKIEVRG